MLPNLKTWFHDPPPPLIFEISEAGISLARLNAKSRLPEAIRFAPLPEGALEASPVRENVHNIDDLERALRQALEQTGPVRKKDAALLLPDNCARMSVLDFENLPGDARERLALIRWRLKKTVPFDVESASIAYQVQRGVSASKPFSVLVAVSPGEVIAQYESAMRRLGLNPGYVSISVAAAVNLVAGQGVAMLAKLSGRILSLVVLDQGQVRLVRSLEAGPGSGAETLSEDMLRGMAADLYPTFVYVADNFGAPVSKLVVAGFGSAMPAASDVFRRELGQEAEPLKGPQGLVDARTAGIWGFLSSN